MIKEVRLKRFKRFKDATFKLHSNGLMICAGPNSSGKSTLLHALAVWAFGVTVVRQFKGDEAVRAGYAGQGAGISDDDFTPINIPDLRHLWLNLKSQVPGEGYSMAISVKWDERDEANQNEPVERLLTMTFSLVQDRLYIKAEDSNLNALSPIPSVVYVPPVAGVDAREEFATLPKRRAMLGRGLAGAVLRNYLYDLEAASRRAKASLVEKKAGKRLNSGELQRFRDADPWERLNEFARQTFGFELVIVPFDADFHSVLRVHVQPKRLLGKTWRNDGVARDLMVEGSGAQQWVTVLTFALTRDTNVLLLDEPDAHLFTRLKLALVDILNDISTAASGPQILMATHSTDILKRHPIERILNFGDKLPRFLQNDTQRAKLISGLGDEYSELIEKARASRRLLFVENDSDRRILQAISESLGMEWPKNLAVVATTDKHADRFKLYKNLLGAIDGLRAVSVLDRDDLNIGQVDEFSLIQTGIKTVGYPEFRPLTWRRREIENYALVASALSKVIDEEKVQEWWARQGWAWPQDMNIEGHLMDCDIKKPLGQLLGKTPVSEGLKSLAPEDIHHDLRVVASSICC